jgi:hypothetical protein
MEPHSRLKIIMPDESIAQPSPIRLAVAPHEIRPMAQVQRIALFEREVVERLSQAGLDTVFARADVISEGEISGVQGKRAFLGSTMLTCDVASLGEIFREPADEGTARRLAALLGKESSLAQRAQAIVRREVERVTRGKPRTVRGETRIRTQGTRIFLDIDVEAAL